MAKKKAITRKASGTLTLNKADQYGVAANMEPDKGRTNMALRSPSRVQFFTDACPADFKENPDQYEVTGSYHFELVFKKKG